MQKKALRAYRGDFRPSRDVGEIIRKFIICGGGGGGSKNERRSVRVVGRSGSKHLKMLMHNKFTYLTAENAYHDTVCVSKHAY